MGTGGPTRWWEQPGATPADCPVCGGAGVPDGCVECGETPRDEPPPDDDFWGDDEPYQWHTASESWQPLGGCE